MNSHEYAAALKQTAERILERPEFEVESQPNVFTRFYDKEKFVAAVRAMGSGQKEFIFDDLRFTPTGTCLHISAPRNKVCRKVREAEYDCEPLLSEKELAELTERA